MKTKSLLPLLVLALLLQIIAGQHIPISHRAPAQAAPTVRYVAPEGDCGGASPCYGVIQEAIDAAASGDEIRIAEGTYYDVNDHGGLSQVAYISKSLSLRGGFTTGNWTTPDPEAHPSELNATVQGRVLAIIGPEITVTVAGLRLSYGNCHDLGGGSGDADAGGGVYVLRAVAKLSHTAVLSSVTPSGSGHAGGGLYIADSTAKMAGCTVQGNTAGDAGGGIYLDDSRATLTDNAFHHNIVGTFGTGAALYAVGGETTLAQSTIRDNECTGGLAVVLDQSPAVLSDNVIADNVDWCGGVGTNHSLQLTGNTVQANSGRGVGIWGRGSFTLTGNFVESNSDEGIWLSLLDGPSRALLRNNRIERNHESTDRKGAGLYLSTPQGWPIWLSGNTIRYNDCHHGNGGGLYIATGGITLTGNLIQHNVSTDDPNPNITNGGGGLYIEGEATLINNVISDNQADARGAGIYIAGSAPTFYHNTIAGNTGDGVGVYVKEANSDPAQPELYNTIVASQTTGIYVSGEALNVARVDGVLWWSNGANTAGDGTVFLFHETTGDPVFTNPLDDDYHILTGSAAIDQGIDAGILLDYDEEPRPYQDPDLGADEFWPAGVLQRIYLPAILKR